MTTNSHFRTRLQKHERMIGPLLQQPLPALAEMCAEAGFDWLFVDMEHGAIDLRDVERIVQAVGWRIPCVVRVPANDRVWIGRVLDLGVAGIIVPQVNSGEQAERAVRAAKYPTAGERGVGGGRAFGYGANAADYLLNANEDAAIIVQIEHQDAVKNLDEIAAVGGVDALMIGPNDLAASMGKLGKLDDPEVLGAIAHVREVGRLRKIPLSLYCGNAEAAKSALEQGFTLIPVASDNAIFLRGAQALVQAIKG